MNQGTARADYVLSDVDRLSGHFTGFDYGTINRGACLLLLAGIFLFSGSLYLLALTNLRWLGPVTPVGGVCFLAGWAWLVLAPPK